LTLAIPRRRVIARWRRTDFYDPEFDRTFVDKIKKQLKRDIKVQEVDIDLDTLEFAQAIVEVLMK
jgi:uncharacterized protein (UPF0261 family)